MRSESGELGFYHGQGASKAESNIGVFQPSTHEILEGEQASVGKGVNHKGVFLGDDSIIIGGMQTARGASTSDILNFYAMQCEAKEGCETEEMELKAIGALEDS